MQKSSNVGTVKLAMQMKPREMWELFSRGRPRAASRDSTSPARPPAGCARYKTWRPIEQATMSYGYGLSASLLQLARAYTVFARDGELIAGDAAAPATSRRAGRRVHQRRRPRARCARCCAGRRPGRHGAEGADAWAIRSAARPAPRASRRASGYCTDKYRAWFVGLAPVSDAAHRRGGDGRRAAQGRLLRRRGGRTGVQPGGAAEPAHAGRGARHRVQAEIVAEPGWPRSKASDGPHAVASRLRCPRRPDGAPSAP